MPRNRSFDPLLHHTHTKKQNNCKKNIDPENRFQFFLAYHGIWLSMRWLVESLVFIRDSFPLLSLTERKQHFLR